MRKILDVKYNSGEKSFVNFYLPDGDCFDLIIWFHGGGLESGSRLDAEVFAVDLVNSGVGIASVEYRMYPEAKFPDFLVDGAASVKFVLDNAGNYGKVNRFFVSGQSAGAYITMMLCFDKHYLADVGASRSKISAFISDSSQVTTHFNVLRERGVDTRLERIDEGAPMYFINEDLEMDNLLIIYYTEDMQCRPEQNRLLYKSLEHFEKQGKAKLVELPGGHCNGSCNRNSKGTFDYVDAVLEYIHKLK